MARPLRFAAPWQPVELTARTFQGRFLLQPSARLNALIAGVLAIAHEKYEVHIYNLVFLSNHFHILAAAPTPAILSSFMCFVMGNLAREVGRHQAWSGSLWDGRYRAIPITDDAALLGRMRYIFENGCKEGLVSHPSQWAGLNAVEALTLGTPIKGIWVDRSAICQAKKRVDAVIHEADFTSDTELVLDALPIWADLSVAERQTRARALVEEAALSAPAPVEQPPRCHNNQDRSPHHRPEKLERSPAPLCHASTKALREAFREAYKSFVNAYRLAAETLREQMPALGFPLHAQVMAFCVPETG